MVRRMKGGNAPWTRVDRFDCRAVLRVSTDFGGLRSSRSTIDLSFLQFQHVTERPTHDFNCLLSRGYSPCLKFFTVTISFPGVCSKRMATPRKRFWPRLPITSLRRTT